MTSNDFCYWLNGIFELSKDDNLTTEQVKIIKDHLALVFNKVTPRYEYYKMPTYIDPYVGDPFFPKVTCKTTVQASC